MIPLWLFVGSLSVTFLVLVWLAWLAVHVGDLNRDISDMRRHLREMSRSQTELATLTGYEWQYGHRVEGKWVKIKAKKGSKKQ